MIWGYLYFCDFRVILPPSLPPPPHPAPKGRCSAHFLKLKPLLAFTNIYTQGMLEVDPCLHRIRAAVVTQEYFNEMQILLLLHMSCKYQMQAIGLCNLDSQDHLLPLLSTP